MHCMALCLVAASVVVLVASALHGLFSFGVTQMLVEGQGGNVASCSAFPSAAAAGTTLLRGPNSIVCLGALSLGNQPIKVV